MPITAGADIDGLTVAGIGSSMSRDDGIGLTLVQALSEKTRLPGIATCFWEDADALTLAHHLLESQQPVLIVDCADMGLESGCWRLFSEHDAVLNVKSPSLSTHGLGLAEALSVARGLGFSLRVYVFGVQPFDLAPVCGLSPQMTEHLPGLLKALQGVVESLASDRCGGAPDRSLQIPSPRRGTRGPVQ